MNMQQNQGKESIQKVHSHVAIKVALILAIICIGINSFVLWHAYRMDQQETDPLIVTVENLAEDISKEVASIGQRLLLLEQTLRNMPANEVDYAWLQDQLKQLSSMEERLTSLHMAVDAQQVAAEELQVAMKEMEQLLNDKYNQLLGRLDELEQTLINQIEKSSVDQFKVDRAPENAVHAGVVITVQRGDTIWDLAAQFENPPTQSFINKIMAYNRISDPTKLKVGQQIIIPEN